MKTVASLMGHANATVTLTMAAWKYRMRWHGEDEATARRPAAEIGATAASRSGP